MKSSDELGANAVIIIADWVPTVENPYGQDDLGLPAESQLLIDAVIGRISIQDDISVQLKNSYRSYLKQCFFDCMNIAVSIMDGVWIFDEYKNFTFDKAIRFSNPAYYTHQLISYIFSKKNCDTLMLSDADELWEILNGLIDKAVDAGAIYNFTKYIKISHVIADIAFDAGYSNVYKNVQQIKAQMGLPSGGKRAASLREVSIAFAKNLLSRGFKEAARQVLLIGFPDIPITIKKLNDGDMKDLLLEMDAPQAVQVLLSEKMSAPLAKGSSAHIIDSVFRFLRM